MRLAITGGCSLAAGLARRAVVAGARRVVGLGVEPAAPGWPSGAAFTQLQDWGDPLAAALDAIRPEVLVHLTWARSTLRRRSKRYRLGPELALRVFRRATGCGVRRIVYWSSALVYGIQPGRTLPFREEELLSSDPRLRHSYQRAQVEQWLPGLQAAQPHLEIVVLRPCFVPGYEHSEPYHKLFSLPLLPRLAGYDPPLQFLHPDDAERILLRSLEVGLPGTYNLAGDGVMLYSEVCRALDRRALPLSVALWKCLIRTGWSLRVSPIPSENLDYIAHSWVADNGLLKTHFGYRPRYSTRDALGLIAEAGPEAGAASAVG